MGKKRLIVYGLVVAALFTLAIYRTSIGPDPSPAPNPENATPYDMANPGLLNDTRGDTQPLQRDFDGDDPRWVNYSYEDVRPIFTARCFTCHAKKDKVGDERHFYDYPSVQKFLEPGNLDSPLPESISVGGSMRKYLSDQEANIVREWVLHGAKP